jgi:hypothetical protein
MTVLLQLSPGDFSGQGMQTVNDERLIADSGFFDAPWYLSVNTDVRESGADPLQHFCSDGWREGRKPNFYFDPAWYAEQQGDAASPDTNPLVHYIRVGERADAAPSVHFDAHWYREAHGLDADESPLRHFLLRRRTGMVSPLPGFDVEAYCTAYPEVLERGLDPYEDYIEQRDAERTAAPVTAAPLVTLPPYSLVVETLGFDPFGDDPASETGECVMEVIKLLLREVALDEAWYLETYPDVADAVARQAIGSAREHYLNFGYFEGRTIRTRTAP